MSFLQISRETAIRMGEPIELLGLTFYPVMMTDYDTFLQCKNALILRMGTLPVRFQRYDYLSAVFAFEMDRIKNTGSSSGLFDRMLRFFYLSLRIGYDRKPALRHISINRKTGMIDSIEVNQNGKKAQITPIEFSQQVRPVLAEQNGLKLPDEAENIDLVRSAEEKKAFQNRNSVKLDTNIDDLISAVAYLSHIREKEIYGWTVREFERRRLAIERDKKFTLYGQAEISGMVSFKNGNPYPSWCFDVIDDSLGTMTMSELQGKTGGINNKQQ